MVSKVIGGKKDKGKIETLCMEDCSSDKSHALNQFICPAWTLVFSTL